ncbi:uncharacterized protein LOC113506097 [Trichoplusia ni]|uniref:Uncharacterized protein LOC113506097 n=1 Tax=Trichoplusia ni TaxID=7111 RepID=A0A7E5WX55_TRINI|nr:uncharacterized protein LOC113506097 [Trichoplusia ni]
MSKLLANDLFLSSDESEAEVKPKRKSEDKKMKRDRSDKKGEGSSSKKSKPTIPPISPPARVTANELFGNEDSDKNECVKSSTKTGNVPPIHSYFTKRQAKGYSRQISETKEGKYYEYVEVKIYDVEEIKKIMPMNRWRYAITSIKTKLDEDKESWHHIKEFILATQKDFKNCPLSYLGSYET